MKSIKIFRRIIKIIISPRTKILDFLMLTTNRLLKVINQNNDFRVNSKLHVKIPDFSILMKNRPFKDINPNNIFRVNFKFKKMTGVKAFLNLTTTIIMDKPIKIQTIVLDKTLIIFR